MVVGVPHCPSRGVLLGLFAFGAVDEAGVAVRPLLKRIQPAGALCISNWLFCCLQKTVLKKLRHSFKVLHLAN